MVGRNCQNCIELARLDHLHIKSKNANALHYGLLGKSKLRGRYSDHNVPVSLVRNDGSKNLFPEQDTSHDRYLIFALATNAISETCACYQVSGREIVLNFILQMKKGNQ